MFSLRRIKVYISLLYSCNYEMNEIDQLKCRFAFMYESKNEIMPSVSDKSDFFFFFNLKYQKNDIN
jgi:hypothetical protein